MTLRTPLLASAAGLVFIIMGSESQAQQVFVSAFVAGSCDVKSNATLAFGNYDPTNGNTASGDFFISCTSTGTVDVTLDFGDHSNGSDRNMEDAGGNRMGYLLSTADGTPWNGAPQQFQVTAADTDTAITVNGQVPTQGVLASRTYTDTVDITVDFAAPSS